MPEERACQPKFEVIHRQDDHGQVNPIHAVMEALVTQHHEHLAEAKIALAWRFGWTANSDGQLTLGKTKKFTELEQDLCGCDFVILLNHEAWNAADFDASQQRALIDHELCHCAVKYDADGEVQLDKREKPVWRMRSHDVEEFADVVSRHGHWKADLLLFAQAALEKENAPLLAGTG